MPFIVHWSANPVKIAPGESARHNSRRRWDLPMNGKLIVAILLIAAVSVAQAQNPRVSKADAEKVVTIIRGDKAKTQTYCEIGKL